MGLFVGIGSDLRPTVGPDKGEPKMLARVEPPIRWRALWTVVDAVDALARRTRKSKDRDRNPFQK